MTAGGVLVVHPAKQHSYQAALAFQKAGELRQFITGIYYIPARFPYSLVRWLPGRFQARADRQLGKRLEPALDPRLIRSWPYAEILSRTVGRMGWLEALSEGRCGYPFVDWSTDWYVSRVLARMRPRPAAVFGFLGGVLRTFARARQLGIPTVLDVPIVFDAAQILRDEYRTLGMRTQVTPPPSVRLPRELGLADWVVAGSPAVADSVRRAGFGGHGIVVVPYGADTSVFTPALRQREGGRFRAIFAGRFEVRKGVHYLLRAWRDAGLDGELVLAGSAGEREFVAGMRQEYGCSFIEAGNLIQPDLARLLASSDVFVFPSLAEGSALVTYQALASGLPSVVTPEAGSVVRDGVEGFIVPARDSRAIADRLTTLYADRELRQRMGRAAVERGRQFTWNRYHEALSGALVEVRAHSGGDAQAPARRMEA